LNIKDEVKASALVIFNYNGIFKAVCPWEIAVSELRVCFILLSVVCVLLGFYAIRSQSRKFADLVIKY
jgi:hypothetical protein